MYAWISKGSMITVNSTEMALVMAAVRGSLQRLARTLHLEKDQPSRQFLVNELIMEAAWVVRWSWDFEVVVALIATLGSKSSPHFGL